MAIKFLVTKTIHNKNYIKIKKNKFDLVKIIDKKKEKKSLKLYKGIIFKNNFNVFRSSIKKVFKSVKNNKLVFDNNINDIKTLEHFTGNQAISSTKIYKSTSLYRGVSKNGHKWQVLFMYNKNKYYLGNYKSEKLAAKLYDYFSINLHRNKAITNFL